jgi:hypothetical protein
MRNQSQKNENLAEDPGLEGGKSWGENALVHVVQILESSTRGETSPHKVQHRHHASALELGKNFTTTEQLRLHLLVGLDATDEVGASAVELLHQALKGTLELGTQAAQGDLALLRLGIARLSLEQRADKRILGGVHKEDKISSQGIVVLANKASGLVADGTSKVMDNEAFIVAEGLVVRHLRLARKLKTEVSLVGLVELVGKVLVRGLRDLKLDLAPLIEKEENTSCLVSDKKHTKE